MHPAEQSDPAFGFYRSDARKSLMQFLELSHNTYHLYIIWWVVVAIQF